MGLSTYVLLSSCLIEYSHLSQLNPVNCKKGIVEAIISG